MKKDLTGKQFNRLKVIAYEGKSAAGRTTLWRCLCQCGREVVVRANNIQNGHTRSCGCYQKETKGKHSLKHGHTRGKKSTKVYSTWSSMLGRCNNKRNDSYKYYGGRGIGVCSEWYSFENFLKDMGEPPDGFEIDRIDNDGDYTKENCRWVTHTENLQNNRACSKIFFEGEYISITELSRRTGNPYHAIRRRIKYWGMTVEEALVSCENLRKVGVNKRREKKSKENTKITS